jgi:hypothetical protein
MFDCEKCRERKLYRYRGCNGYRRIGNAEEPIALDRFGRWKVECCPRLYATRQVITAVRLWQFYQKGFLPFSGGILNQPFRVAQWFQTIDAEISKIEAEKDV